MTQTLAHLAIQCTAANGATGTFLFDPAGGKGPKEAPLLSPVFADSLDCYLFAQQRGWAASRIGGGVVVYRRDDAPAMVAVHDLQPGDKLDLEGDLIADPRGEEPALANEYVVVAGVEEETADCIRVDGDNFACGFPHDHRVKVDGFNGDYVEGVTGAPAALIVRGVAIG